MIKYRDENFYRALDGTPFGSKEDCLAYEMDAGGIGDKVRAGMLAKTNEYNLKECMDAFASGIEEYDVEIYRPKDAAEIKMINEYLDFYNINFSDSDKRHIDDSYIGKYVIMKFDVGRNGAYVQTPEMIYKIFMDTLEEMIEKGE